MLVWGLPFEAIKISNNFFSFLYRSSKKRFKNIKESKLGSMYIALVFSIANKNNWVPSALKQISKFALFNLANNISFQKYLFIYLYEIVFLQFILIVLFFILLLTTYGKSWVPKSFVKTFVIPFDRLEIATLVFLVKTLESNNLFILSTKIFISNSLSKNDKFSSVAIETSLRFLSIFWIIFTNISLLIFIPW